MSCDGLVSKEDLQNSKLDADSSSEYVSSDNPTLTTRLGKIKKTVQGMNDDNQSNIDQFNLEKDTLFDDFQSTADNLVFSTGFINEGLFSVPDSVSSAQGTLTFDSGSGVGEEWAVTALSYPYTPNTTSPYTDTAGGTWRNVTLEARKTVARSLNVKDSEVIYHDDTVTLLDDVIYIYDKSSNQKTWQKPAGLPLGAQISAVVGDQLTYNPGAVTVTLGDIDKKVANVLHYGADRGGVVDVTNAFKAALADAISKQIPMYIPAGRYYYPNNESLQATTCDKLVIYGDGDLSEIIFDDYVNPTTFTPFLLGETTETIGRLEMYNFKIKGKWSEEIDFSENSTMIYFWHVLDLWVNNITMENSRSSMLLVEDCKNSLVTGSRFRNSYRDACRLMETETAQVKGNYFKGIQDDSIAVSTRDGSRIYDDSSTIITNNMIIDSQGITSLGAKKTVIDDNIINRPMSLGVRVGQSEGFETGHTPIVSLSVCNNSITDVFRGTLFSPMSSNEQYGIQVYGRPMLLKDTVGSWDGSKIVRPYEYLYTFNNNDPLAVNAGHWNLVISGNTIARTLPPATNYSDYGYGQRLSRSGFVDPAVSDSDLWHDGITFEGAAYNLRVSENTIMGATTCINFDTTGLSPNFAATTWRDVTVSDNTLHDFRESGVKATGTGYISVVDNDFNGDPYVTIPIRNGLDGSWQGTYAQHSAINQATPSCTFRIDGNKFRNVGIPVQSSGAPTIWGKNIQHCEPVAVGYNSSNKGLGFVHSPAIAGSIVIEQSNPSVANFGRSLNVTSEATTDGNPPSSGTYVQGQFVRNANNSVQIVGWNRGTTGSGHTVGGIGSDWIVLWGTPDT